ncbi:YlmH/Sll1252 family protein [Clostridium rectalis]|uniref:YlmH/Sll1252 family protein n=1 Tax=Clostridium rectalis TaxID=2040295 RepID=UPI000F635918|nr:YlmH/Sll1252 family protein [Clostridium rectalis]
MIDKKQFLDYFTYEDKNRLSQIYDKILFCNKTGITTFTEEFFTPLVWKVLQGLRDSLPVQISSNGVFMQSERRIIAFSIDQVWEYPIVLLRIKSKSSFKKLSHKDFLGALMSLGIRREKIGDLIIYENCCFVTVSEGLENFILCNLISVGNCPCEVEIVDIYSEYIPDYNFEDLNLISTSLRLDCIVSSIINLSRNKSLELISSGRVLLNYMTVREKNKIVQKQDIITIRGFGKYKFIEDFGFTNSGRLRVLIKKFV